MRWLVIALVGLGGCDQVFGLRGHEVDATAADPDVGIDALSCITPAVSDAFDNSLTSPCTAFGGFNNSNVSVVIRNGAFEVTPDPTAPNSLGGCISITPSPFTPAGVFAEISAVGTGAKEYTVLFANWEAANGERSVIGSNGNELAYSRGGVTFGAVPYDAIAMRWWRMRPIATGIIGEYSANGIAWTLLGVDATPPPARIRIEFDLGTYDVEPTASTAVFQGINVCP